MVTLINQENKAMLELNKDEDSSLKALASNPRIIEVIFAGMVLLCFIGDIIGEVSDRMAILYWILMTPVFFLCTVIVEKAQILACFKPAKNNVQFNLTLWGSASISVIMVLFLWHSGAFSAETVGLIIHIILAHSMFITGTVLGLRFYLIGLLLFIMAWFTINLEGAVALFLMLTLPFTIIGFYFKKYNLLHIKNRRHNQPFRS